MLDSRRTDEHDGAKVTQLGAGLRCGCLIGLRLDSDQGQDPNRVTGLRQGVRPTACARHRASHNDAATGEFRHTGHFGFGAALAGAGSPQLPGNPFTELLRFAK